MKIWFKTQGTKMNTLKSTKLLVAIFMVAAVFAGCDTLDFEEPSKTYDGPSLVKFTSDQNNLTLQEDTELRSIELSVLKAPEEDMTITVSAVYSEEVTAEEGVPYSFVNGNEVTIPAGELFGSLDLEIYTNELSCDTRLALQLDHPNAADFNTTTDVRFIILTPFNANAFPGTYNVVYPWWSGSAEPYEAQLVTGEGENEFVFQGLTDEDINVTIVPEENQSDYTVTLPDQVAWFSNFYSADVYAVGSTEAIYDFCELSFTMDIEHYIPGLGSFGANPASFTKQ